jgi:hypothetical protein
MKKVISLNIDYYYWNWNAMKLGETCMATTINKNDKNKKKFKDTMCQIWRFYLFFIKEEISLLKVFKLNIILSIIFFNLYNNINLLY